MALSFTRAIIPIAVVNESKTVSDLDFQTAVIELQRQISRDFAPIWQIDAKLTVYSDAKKLPPDSWWLIILDDADGAGYLGYHDLTNYGLPLGKVFAKTTEDYGGSWTVTASHELLEMLADPYINETVFNQYDNFRGTLYAYEVCDAVQDDAQGYMSGTVKLSNFVFPSWFELYPSNSTKYDFLGITTAPFQIAPYGYMSIFEVYGASSGWQQIWGKSRTVAPITSTDRTALRNVKISQYVKSNR